MLPSSVLFGGAVAVFANALYPLAKAREAKYRLASDARTILLPEVKRNADLGLSMQGSLAEGKLILPLQKFDVTAWETISKGGLLLGLEPAEIVNFLHVYRLAYEAMICVSRSWLQRWASTRRFRMRTKPGNFISRNYGAR